jgi:hypothetical protein
MPEDLDGLQNRCPHCRRYSIVQGPVIAEGEDSQADLRAIAPETRLEAPPADQAQFPRHQDE